MLTKEQRSLLESKTVRYQDSVHLAEEYLEGRGFTADTVGSARLGVVDEAIDGDPHAAGFRLSIPYITTSGVINIRYRCLREHDHKETSCPKYLSSSGIPNRIYGARSIISAGSRICVTEGELDALTFHQSGYPAAGVPGAQSWQPWWRLLFEDFERVYVFGDGDDAGRAFVKKVCAEIPASIPIVMPDKMDVNEQYARHGRGFFDELLR